MARSVVWQCDSCNKESRVEGDGWLMLKEFRTSSPRPRFYAFCCWACMVSFAQRK